MGNEKGVKGVTWLDNKIYVVCSESKNVFVYSDKLPFTRLPEEEFQISEMMEPWDMTSAEVNRSIYISDCTNKCIWIIETAGKTVQKMSVDGDPKKISVTRRCDELIVVVKEDHNPWTLTKDSSSAVIVEMGNCVVGIYSIAGSCHSMNLPLPPEIVQPIHVIQSANHNFTTLYISDRTTDSRRVNYMIGEIDRKGTLIRNFDPHLALYWDPVYLAAADDHQIFIADCGNSRLIILDSELTTTRLHQGTEWVSRLKYVKSKHLLIVGHRFSWSMKSSPQPAMISILSLSFPENESERL